MQPQFVDETRAVAETLSDVAVHLKEMFKDIFNAYLTNKQTKDLLDKGKTEDWVNINNPFKGPADSRDHIPAILSLNQKFLKELKAGDSSNLTAELLKKNVYPTYTFGPQNEPYVDKLASYLPKEQFEELKTNKFIKDPVEIDFGKGKSSYFIGINPDTNEPVLFNTQNIRIPDNVKGADLTHEKEKILKGEVIQTKILSNNQPYDANIFFCQRTGKLKTIQDSDTKQFSVDLDMQVPNSKYFNVTAGDKQYFINVNEFAAQLQSGNLKDKTVANYLQLKERFGSAEVKVSTSNLRSFELATPNQRLILHHPEGRGALVNYAEFSAYQNGRKGISERGTNISADGQKKSEDQARKLKNPVDFKAPELKEKKERKASSGMKMKQG